MHIWIFEDDVFFQNRLAEMIRKYEVSHCDKTFFETITQVKSDHMACLDEIEWDRSESRLFIIDVDLKNDYTGFDLASRIREVDYNSEIVFITSHMEMMNHVFLLNLKVLNYIYKLDPMLEDRLGSVLEVVSRTQCQKARETANQSNAMTVKHLILPTKEGLKKIAVDEILVLETMQLRRKVEVLTQDDSYEIARTLKDLLEELPCYFMHSHRSIVLNTRRITEIYVKDGYHQAVMASGEKYSISRNYVKNITRAFQQK